MGTFGLGGLHRKSTWLYPVEDVGDLPPAAVDGAAVVVKALRQVWEWDDNTQTWINTDTGGGGGGSSNVFLWTVGMSWATLYNQIQTNGGWGVVIVDPDTSPRLVTGATINFQNLVMIGATKDMTPVQVDFANGVSLGGSGVLRSKDILWRPLCTSTQIISVLTGGMGFEFDGGGMIGWDSVGASIPMEVSPGFNYRIALHNGAIFDGSPLTSAAALVRVNAGASIAISATSNSRFGPKAFTSPVSTTSPITLDASSRIASGATVGSAGLSITLLDAANLVTYDDSLPPALGSTNVQGAIDALKAFANANGADQAFVMAMSGI